MAGKKDKSLIYWEMNYQGKLRRTWVMLPIVIIVAIIFPFYTADQYGSVWYGILLDIFMVAVWAAQLLYNMNKVKTEQDKQNDQTRQNGSL